jgi:hypothetical protein
LKKKSLYQFPRYEGVKVVWNVVDLLETNEPIFIKLGGIVDPIDAHKSREFRADRTNGSRVIKIQRSAVGPIVVWFVGFLTALQHKKAISAGLTI